MTHEIRNEIAFLRTVNGTMHARVQYQPLPARTAPDQAVRELAWPDGQLPDDAIVHSTSWRYDTELTLTWIVHPDPHPELPATPVTVYAPVEQTDAAHPAPDPDQVVPSVEHAVRHLAFLADHDPAIVAIITRNPELQHALAPHRPDVAGEHTETR